jgi:hypothetical protein
MSFEMDETPRSEAIGEPLAIELENPNKEDQECPICKESMGTESYANSASKDVAMVHRLVCKHAFHSDCLLMSFRASGSVACPMCRGIESGNLRSSTVQRNGFAITITETDQDSDDSSNADPWVDMTTLLRPHRGLPHLQALRRRQQQDAKTYHQLRDRLRADKRKYVNKALADFRRDRRADFRAVQEQLKSSTLAVFEAERQSFIDAEGQLAYSRSTWKHIHQILGSGIQYKDEMSGRKQDPWNSAFWYA